jgi:hypothetical protein
MNETAISGVDRDVGDSAALSEQHQVANDQ